MLRFKNALVMDMCEDTHTEYKEVWTEGGRIAFCGKPDSEMLKNAVFEKEYDLENCLIMPSFKNAHTHSAMTFLRSYADDLPLQEWLFDRVFPMEEKLTGEDIYWFTKLAILEYLSSGITASFDMYFEPEDYFRANVESGFRTVMCGSVSGSAADAARLEEFYLRFNGRDPLVSYRLGFHAEYTAEYGLMEEIAALAKKYKAPVSVHNSETAKEVRECVEKYGKTPTALFDSLGIYDMDIFRRRNVYAVTCPGSNSKLASGIAPLCRMRENGVKIAVGTDGAASNNCLDMFREMFLMTALQKLSLGDAAAFPAQEALKAACCGSALAMGLDDCDRIAKGKQADLLVLDLSKPNMQPLNAIDKNIVYSGSKQNVRMTVCAGKVLYENGVYHINADEKEIYAHCAERCAVLKD